MKVVVLIALLVTLKATASAQPRAEDLYAQGQAAYERADYATAIAKWQASYDLSKESGLLFNLAQAKRLAGDCAGAIVTYRRFAATDTDSASDQHKLARDFVRELEETCLPVVATPLMTRPTTGSGTPSTQYLKDPESGHGRSGRSWKITGVVTSGGGVVALTIGLGLGHHGASIGDEITAACETSCDWAVHKDKEARGKRAVAIGKLLDAVGVAAIAGGAVLYYLGVRKDETVTVTPAPGGGGVVSWGGAW